MTDKIIYYTRNNFDSNVNEKKVKHKYLTIYGEEYELYEIDKPKIIKYNKLIKHGNKLVPDFILNYKPIKYNNLDTDATELWNYNNNDNREIKLNNNNTLTYKNKTFGTGDFKILSLGELYNWVEYLLVDEKNRDKTLVEHTKWKLFENTSITDLIPTLNTPCPVVQLASQSNFLEMISQYITPKHGHQLYAKDPTQGPRVAILTLASLFERLYLKKYNEEYFDTYLKNNKNENAKKDGILSSSGAQYYTLKKFEIKLKELLSYEQDVFIFKNGYLFLEEKFIKKINKKNYVEIIISNENMLKNLIFIGFTLKAQISITGFEKKNRKYKMNKNKFMTNVFSSALPFTYDPNMAGILKDSHAYRFYVALAKINLDAMYEGLILVGIINNIFYEDNNIYLTRVGGGAFGNKHEWINSSIENCVKNVKKKLKLKIDLSKYNGLNLNIHEVSFDPLNIIYNHNIYYSFPINSSLVHSFSKNLTKILNDIKNTMKKQKSGMNNNRVTRGVSAQKTNILIDNKIFQFYKTNEDNIVFQLMNDDKNKTGVFYKDNKLIINASYDLNEIEYLMYFYRYLNTDVNNFNKFHLHILKIYTINNLHNDGLNVCNKSLIKYINENKLQNTLLYSINNLINFTYVYNYYSINLNKIINITRHDIIENIYKQLTYTNDENKKFKTFFKNKKEKHNKILQKLNNIKNKTNVCTKLFLIYDILLEHGGVSIRSFQNNILLNVEDIQFFQMIFGEKKFDINKLNCDNNTIPKKYDVNEHTKINNNINMYITYFKDVYNKIFK